MEPSEIQIEQLEQAKHDFAANNLRSGLLKLITLLKQDISNEIAWQLMYQFLGNGKPFNLFQIEIAKKFFPDKVQELFRMHFHKTQLPNSQAAATVTHTIPTQSNNFDNPLPKPSARPTPALSPQDPEIAIIPLMYEILGKKSFGNDPKTIFHSAYMIVEYAVDAFKKGKIKTHYKLLNHLISCKPFGTAVMAVYRNHVQKGSVEWQIIDNYISRKLVSFTEAEIENKPQTVLLYTQSQKNAKWKVRQRVEEILSGWIDSYNTGEMWTFPWDNLEPMILDEIKEYEVALREIPYPDDILFHYPFELKRCPQISEKPIFGMYNGNYMFMRVEYDIKNPQRYMVFYKEDTLSPIYSIELSGVTNNFLLGTTFESMRLFKLNPMEDIGRSAKKVLTPRSSYSKSTFLNYFMVTKPGETLHTTYLVSEMVKDRYAPFLTTITSFGGEYQWRIIRDFEYGRYDNKIEELLFLYTVFQVQLINDNLNSTYDSDFKI